MNRQLLSHHGLAYGVPVALLLSVAPALLAQSETDRITVNSATLQSEGKELGTAHQQGLLADLFKLQKDLVYEVLQQLGIDPAKLAPAIKAAIDKPSTQNLKAFLAFSNGLDLLDQGRYAEAEATFREAAELDPNFEMARELRDAMPRIAQEAAEIADAGMREARTQETVGALLSTPQDILALPVSELESARTPEPLVAPLLKTEDQKISDQTGQVRQTEIERERQAQAQAAAATQTEATVPASGQNQVPPSTFDQTGTPPPQTEDPIPSVEIPPPVSTPSVEVPPPVPTPSVEVPPPVPTPLGGNRGHDHPA